MLGFLCLMTALTATGLLSVTGQPPTRYLTGKTTFKPLPAPPADGSKERQREIEAVLKMQAERTERDVERIRRDAKMTPFSFAPFVAKDFTAENYPETAKLLQACFNDAAQISEEAKKPFARPRPFTQDERIVPCLEKSKSFSYPSGQATLGMVLSLVLTDLFPDKRKELAARAEEVGYDRVRGGVHYPSDIRAGFALGREVYAALKRTPAFQTDFAKARAEIAGRK